MAESKEVKGDEPFTDDNLFFGTAACKFSIVPGATFRYVQVGTTSLSCSQSICRKTSKRPVMRKRDRLLCFVKDRYVCLPCESIMQVRHLGAGYETLIIPAIPATDLIVKKDTDLS